MFQQFKNIFPNASLNITSITNSIGINEAGINRLEAIKSEFSNLNSLLHNQPEPDIIEQKDSNRTSIIDLESTGQVIHKIQEGIESIHELNLENYKKQRVVDKLLGKLQHTGRLHYKVHEQIEHSESDLSDIQNNITQIQHTAIKLIDTLTTLEQQIDQVNLENEQREFELWKQNEENELINEIAIKKQLLKEKEMGLKQRYEEYEKIQQKKRLELYEATFNAELEEYKRKRETEISSLYPNSKTSSSLQTSLEQLQLLDHGNKEELEDFFGENEIKRSDRSKEVNSHLSSSEDERIDILHDEDYEDF
ncbi:hypothetical protein G6F46_012239 [Rhizopus delemar]|uniref:Uncharacterized protein n=2 Tax=Rhizopus TaxID=4842 RepID=A0A9P7CK14_9FUNG|nr:hypothetical protein G6F55_009820 [Rhizopus delemar]KAG1533913.1 hypothetical protein G6F51_012377 [Rhizopus arrhizus]KAG1508795.1 hypothetical protein G6F52_011304 [Rhizopus delemar]KAG1539283.1 hypothetical protein G6F49_012400 [Rhizopus delemar]KAG1565001.1 hypothetical protein G6F50_010481 [Rhizopus delemar]